MFTPKPFIEDDFERLRAVVESNGFGLLLSNGPQSPAASHLPFLIDLDTETGEGRLHCHMARANPHWQTVESDPSVLAIFTGAHGRARTEHEPSALRGHLENLIAVHETGRSQPWSMAEAPADFIDKMLNGIVGIEIAIERIEGKRKMSQNRSTADQAGVIAGLRSEGTEAGLDLAAEMAPSDFSWYRNNG